MQTEKHPIKAATLAPWRGVAEDAPTIDAIQTYVIVIDRDYRIMMANPLAAELMGVAPSDSLEGRTCFGSLAYSDSPCRDCPIAQGGPLEASPHPLKIVTPAGEDRYLKEGIRAWGEGFVLTFNEVTREIVALKKADFARKEYQAKKIILERYRREAEDEKERLGRLVDDLPEAVALVNRDFRILQRNRAVVRQFPSGNSATCYGLLGKDSPCETCPAKGGFGFVGTRKTNHLVDGHYYTERIIRSLDSDLVSIVFRDATREIQLIEKIRKQRETITKNNEILSRLVRLEGTMQQEKDPKQVADLFIDFFLSACDAQSASVFILDHRPSRIWFTTQKGFDGQQMAALTKICLERRRGTASAERISTDVFESQALHQFDIRGGDGREVGYAFWLNSSDVSDPNMISLIFEPFGAFIHTRLLMRLLEERANTDPLTGVYNRRYLSAALEEERRKYDAYDIPYALVLADINRLKQANDRYGHATGDKLIQTVAERLGSAIREGDVTARTGGDEFVLLLTNATQSDAEQLVARLEGTIFKGVAIDVPDGGSLPVTVSFGVSGVDMVPPDDLFEVADKRLYRSKASYYGNQERYR